MKNINNITILGGGNIGTLLAVDLAALGKFNITMLTSDESKWSTNLKSFDGDDNLLKEVTIDRVTSSIEEAFTNADMVISTLPSDAYHKLVPEYIPFLKKDTFFGVMPGMGGKEFLFLKNENYFAIQRVPGVSRLKTYGHEVYDLGKRDTLYVGSFDWGFSKKLSVFFTEVLEIETKPVESLLSITLTPSNPILHTSRLFRLGKQEPFDHAIKFYHEWDDLSSEIILEMDQEVQNISMSFEEINLSNVVSLKEHYESNNVREFTKKLTSISSLKTIDSPLLSNEKGYVLDLSSRYFTEDMLYGLAIIKSFGIIAGVNTPKINEVLNWYNSLIENPFFSNDTFITTTGFLPHEHLDKEKLYVIYK